MDLAQFGASGAVVVVVIVFLKFLREEGKNRDKTYELVSEELSKLSNSTDKNTQATKSADEYLRERNGRDNEHHGAVLTAINEIPKTMKKIANAQSKAIINAVSVNEQSVKEQTVKHQTIVKEQ